MFCSPNKLTSVLEKNNRLKRYFKRLGYWGHSASIPEIITTNKFSTENKKNLKSINGKIKNKKL